MTTERQRTFLTAIQASLGPKLRRFLLARLRRPRTDVADLMQEVYLRMLRIDNHDAIRNPQAHLYTVASHVLHQHMLKENPPCDPADIANLSAELESRTPSDPAREAQIDERYEEIGRMLEKIAPRA